jgi:hypothetical protein
MIAAIPRSAAYLRKVGLTPEVVVTGHQDERNCGVGLGDGQSAAAQFQKLIDNPGLSVRHVIGPLARIQLGRAQNMMGDNASARNSYEEFLSIWKDADPDLPIYRQAKAEYAKLRRPIL